VSATNHVKYKIKTNCSLQPQPLFMMCSFHGCQNTLKCLVFQGGGVVIFFYKKKIQLSILQKFMTEINQKMFKIGENSC